MIMTSIPEGSRRSRIRKVSRNFFLHIHMRTAQKKIIVVFLKTHFNTLNNLLHEWVCHVMDY